MSMRSWLRIAWAIVACYAAGAVGALFVTDGTAAWYAGLVKPVIMPPNWLFAPVWTILYGLMAAAVVIIWNKDRRSQDNSGWVQLFFAHLIANGAWTIFFFGFHAVLIALIDVSILIVAVTLLTVGAFEIDRRAGYLLLPYLAWILFAAALTYEIWILN